MIKSKKGDNVRIDYISDSNEHNGKIGKLTFIKKYKYFPTGYLGKFKYKYQAIIEYDDNSKEYIQDVYRQESGTVGKIIKVK